jgi:hypothetical protein
MRRIIKVKGQLGNLYDKIEPDRDEHDLIRISPDQIIMLGQQTI